MVRALRSQNPEERHRLPRRAPAARSGPRPARRIRDRRDPLRKPPARHDRTRDARTHGCGSRARVPLRFRGQRRRHRVRRRLRHRVQGRDAQPPVRHRALRRRGDGDRRVHPRHHRLRARGQAFGSFTHWIFAAAISQTFPLIAEQSGAHVFAFYSVCMVGQLIWVLTKMPETKNIPLEEIQKRLGIK
ncbi:MAG: MFS transporter [Planctomycetes bacterium]|nr:MFS transporter [Planctomycetota bacterium]